MDELGASASVIIDGKVIEAAAHNPLIIIDIFFTLGLSAVSQARNAPITCAIQCYDGHYLTAVNRWGPRQLCHSRRNTLGCHEDWHLGAVQARLSGLIYFFKECALRKSSLRTCIGWGTREGQLDSQPIESITVFNDINHLL